MAGEGGTSKVFSIWRSLSLLQQRERDQRPRSHSLSYFDSLALCAIETVTTQPRAFAGPQSTATSFGNYEELSIRPRYAFSRGKKNFCWSTNQLNSVRDGTIYHKAQAYLHALFSYSLLWAVKESNKRPCLMHCKQLAKGPWLNFSFQVRLPTSSFHTQAQKEEKEAPRWEVPLPDVWPSRHVGGCSGDESTCLFLLCCPLPVFQLTRTDFVQRPAASTTLRKK